MTDSTVLAYLAGIVDADGYIGIQRRMPTPANHLASPKYSGRLSVTQVDREAVYLFSEVWPELKITIRKRRFKNNLPMNDPNGTRDSKPLFVIDVEQDRAIHLIKALHPFLRIKKRSAELVIRLREVQRESRKHRTKIVSTATFKKGPAKGHRYRVYGLSDEYIATCEELYQRCKQLRK